MEERRRRTGEAEEEGAEITDKNKNPTLRMWGNKERKNKNNITNKTFDNNISKNKTTTFVFFLIFIFEIILGPAGLAKRKQF